MEITMLSRFAGLTLLAGITMGSQSDKPRTVAGVSGAPCAESKTVLQHGTTRTLPHITVTYQDSDIRDVVAAFATFTGRTIKVADNVQGLVTTQISDTPWDEALQSILSMHQLTASEDQYGIITVTACNQ